MKRVALRAATLPVGGDVGAMSPAAMGLPVMKGGPGTSTPGRIHYVNVTLMQLIGRAYGIEADQIRGPERLTSDRYVLDAIVPSGAGAEEFRQMLQRLLVKRFRLAFRWEERDYEVYHLVVGAGGAKLRRSAVVETADSDDNAVSEADRIKAPLDKSGCPVLPLTRRGVSGRSGGSNCATFVGFSMPELVTELANDVALETTTADLSHTAPAHIMDDTGLTGRFDFNLNYNKMYFLSRVPGFPLQGNVRFTPSDSIFKVVQSQLGLRLESRPSKLKVMVVEHIENDPGEN